MIFLFIYFVLFQTMCTGEIFSMFFSLHWLQFQAQSLFLAPMWLTVAPGAPFTPRHSQQLASTFVLVFLWDNTGWCWWIQHKLISVKDAVQCWLRPQSCTLLPKASVFLPTELEKEINTITYPSRELHDKDLCIRQEQNSGN
jgi:hypothetical protein